MENHRAEHVKVHLFDINAPGDISFKESDNFTSGDRSTVVDTVTNMSFSSTSQFGEIIETAVHEETTVIAEVNYSMIPLRSGLKEGGFTPAGEHTRRGWISKRDKSHTQVYQSNPATNMVSGPTTPSTEEGSVKPLDLRKRAR
ncbi:hypothetical protein IFM89_030667 [Coptis chinensis]|uniref:Uncharacterized protein n=1 Tax=Coptis chinensis TaxID=261450 RepID=A0A835GYU4_9MAGN|nr:hypothetical protein IFM89_030667 [Coptis chinensis]